MNFIQASLSGQRFKRPDWKFCLFYDQNGKLRWEHGDPADLDFSLDWLQYQDWILVERTSPINKSRFMAAYKEACDEIHGGANFVSVLEVVEKMADKLNL
jgi:hypothetical protein